MYRRHYGILNTRLLLESDAEEFLNLFHRDYSWFESLYLSSQSRFSPHTVEAPSDRDFRNGKIPLRPDCAGIKIAGRPCRLRALICLDPEEGAGTDWCELVIGLKEQAESSFLKAAREISGVILEKGKAGACEWRLRYPKRKSLSGKVRELLAHYRESIWNVFLNAPVRPDFSGEPVLMPMAVHEASFFVLREMKQQPDLIGPSETKAMECFMEINDLLQGVSCYRLTCGRLERQKELVMGAVGTME